MSLISVDDDPWISEYECCNNLLREIADLLSKRNVELRSSDTYANLSSIIRVRAQQYSSEFSQISKKLRDPVSRSHMTMDEAERRERLLENLHTNAIQLENRFNDRDSMSKKNRTELFGCQIDYGSENSLEAYSLDVDQLRTMQKEMLTKQDAGLDELSKTISRQKNIAVRIGTEVDVHNDILEDISDRMERTTSGLRSGTEQITVIARKDSTCWYWVIITFLFVAIVCIWI